MSRRWIVLAISLSLVAVAAWLAVLGRSAPSSSTGTRVAAFTAAPTPAPSAPHAGDATLAPDAKVLDGPIIDLGHGVEVTVPSYFQQEKVSGFPHATTFVDEGRRIRVVVSANPASKPRRHDDPLDGARELARSQKTTITHFETTPDGVDVTFDGQFEHTPMRQYLIVKRSARARVSAWVILLDSGIDHPENLTLLEELRTGGRLVAR